eukprot:4326057-Amphidinium_carterae.1
MHKSLLQASKVHTVARICHNIVACQQRHGTTSRKAQAIRLNQHNSALKVSGCPITAIRDSLSRGGMGDAMDRESPPSASLVPARSCRASSLSALSACRGWPF